MPGQAIHITAAGPKCDRQAIWEVVRVLGKNKQAFTVVDIGKQMNWNAQENRIFTYLRCLEKGGYLSAKKQAYKANTYTLEKDTGVDAPRLRYDGTPVTQGACREQMWRAMRILGSFNADTLALSASTDQHTVSLVDAKDYCHHLHKAGYLTGSVSGYRFNKSKNTGPKPPKIQRVKQVFDANLGKVVWPTEATDEAE